MPEVSLQGTGIVSLIGKREAAGVPQHVRMGLEAQMRLNASTPNHAGEASGAKWGTTFRCEHEGRLGFLLALHWGIPHDLLNARLIHGELRQMLFSRYARRRHLRKLLLHLLKDTARL
jgi:hypothetical protein